MGQNVKMFRFFFKVPSLARSVPKPLKVPSLARSMQKPLKGRSARSVQKPLNVSSLGRSVPKPCVGEAGGHQTNHYHCESEVGE